MATSEYLTRIGFETATEMQDAYWKLDAPNTILLSDTGSGKTLAFLLQLLRKFPAGELDAPLLVLCPTRELAQQVFSIWTSLRTPNKSVLCIGGHSFKNEVLQLAENPMVVIGTPGRVLDHYDRNTTGIPAFGHWIVDEYDKTLEFGFLAEITQIFEFRKNLKTIQLISATVIDELPRFLSDYTFETLNYLGKLKPEMRYYAVRAEGHDKLLALVSFLAILEEKPSLVFCTHRETAERISQHLHEYGKANELFHGGLEQSERERALIKFKHATVDCLVCTDLAARGLDIPDIGYVIHYQFPQRLEDFTHRNGRTARMQKDGEIYLIHSEEEPLPSYLDELEYTSINAPKSIGDFPESKWLTLYITAGRKDKIRKMDIAGFFMKDLGIPAQDLASIDVFDSYSYVALSKKAYLKNKNNFFKAKIKKFAVRIHLCK